jgi:hypothetical protein
MRRGYQMKELRKIIVKGYVQMLEMLKIRIK